MSDTALIDSPLQAALNVALGDVAQSLVFARGEWTLTVPARDYYNVMMVLTKAQGLQFEQLIDLCGVDFQEYSGTGVFPNRFAVVVHLLSVSLNQRLRVRVFAEDDGFPCVASVSSIWASAAWFEREAFDLFGVMFDGHEDLRRILTDYGFVGHPFRKDFPISGHVEMRYDSERQRVIYEPVSIEPRENTPRIVREDNYGGLH
jgi:NADH-quinone oxidoreductase subunit C